jgi:enamine deaminase RidA (YjgF/YER057c/UK114 family)
MVMNADAAQVKPPSARLRELGVALPASAVPGVRVSYRRVVIDGTTAYLSGHLPIDGRELTHRGRIGQDLDLEAGVAAARSCALSMLRTIEDELGSIDAVERWLQVNAFVCAVPGFTMQPQVANGFTDLIQQLWGDERLAARTAVGASDLPLGVPVEVAAVVRIAARG